MMKTTLLVSEDSDNFIERAAQKADDAVEAGRRSANAAVNTVADKVTHTVHGLRDRTAPVLDRIAAPFDTVAIRTQQSPWIALLAAAAAGAVLMAGVSLLFRSER